MGSVRGCVVGPDLSVLMLVLLKKGEAEITGLTDDSKPRRLGPKRASNIRKLFNLDKKDDVRKFVIRFQKGKHSKAPKIQRLLTKKHIQRKKKYRKIKKARKAIAKQAKEDYTKRLHEYQQEVKDARAAEVAKKKKEKKPK